MPSSCFDVKINDAIAHIVLARPEAFNAMVPAFWNELPALVREIDAGAKARVIVISAAGKHFSSGLDTGVLANLTAGQTGDAHARAEALRHFVKLLQQSFTCLEEARVPVIAAIQGGCIGGAMSLISACDIRFATDDAFFQLQEINLGITADVGAFPRLCRLMPEGWVRELAYTGRRLPAAGARELGLVNNTFPTHEALLAYVMDVAREIAEKSPLAVAGSKRMINYARDHATADALDYVATWQAGMLAPEHIAEAFAAKSEHRAPAFPDLAPLKQEM